MPNSSSCQLASTGQVNCIRSFWVLPKHTLSSIFFRMAEFCAVILFIGPTWRPEPACEREASTVPIYWFQKNTHTLTTNEIYSNAGMEARSASAPVYKKSFKKCLTVHRKSFIRRGTATRRGVHASAPRAIALSGDAEQHSKLVC